MANPSLTEIVCVFDKSGSMSHLAEAARTGFNEFLDEQRKLDGLARLTLTLFDTEYLEVYGSVPLEEVKPLDVYATGGMTALLDAVGKTIDELRARISKLIEEEQPGKVVFLIMTDGMENSSKEYLGDQVAKMVKEREEKDSWQFVFLGANIDSFAVGGGMNVRASNVVNYVASGQGMDRMYRSVGKAVSNYRDASMSLCSDALSCSLEEDKDEHGFVKDHAGEASLSVDVASGDSVTVTNTGDVSADVVIPSSTVSKSS